MRVSTHFAAGLWLCGTALTAHAGEKLVFTTPIVLSQEVKDVPGGADPGGAADKGRLLQLTQTPGGVHDGRLVAFYGDATNADAIVWHPDSGEHLAQDIFARYSDDDGVTWSDPVNLSRTADKYSAMTDWKGDGIDRPFFGDSGKPTVFSQGNNIVVSWNDTYAPESDWKFGDFGESKIQGRIRYEDPEDPKVEREVPFACVYVAVSNDGGTTWARGELAPPLQVTYGRRDAIEDVHRGMGKQWILTWQEDPLGLQPGEAHGPGEGYSGAKVTEGTDIWYSYTTDIVLDPEGLRRNRTPLSDNSVYDTTGTNGYPMVGPPGSRSIQGGSRCNMSLVRDDATVYATMAYEETKGNPGSEFGKTVQYHAFPLASPPHGGVPSARFGSAGTTLSDTAENGRRVRFFTQQVNGVDPAIVIFWRQGIGAYGAPADIVLKVATAVDEASVAAATPLNITANMPNATAANLSDKTYANAIENALAHRGFLRGSTIVFGASYTSNGPLAAATDLANYDFYIRRSLDGGATWLPVQNVSKLQNKKLNVVEPRIVAPPGGSDSDVFVVAWATETNVPEGLAKPEPVDVFIRRATKSGTRWSATARLGSVDTWDRETQVRLDPTGERIHVVWMSGPEPWDAMFASGHPVEVPDSGGGGGGCVARPGAPVDPALLTLLLLAVPVTIVRSRRSWRSPPA